MKTRINQSKTGAALLLTFHEGFSTYTITLPMPYGVRFFVEGLQTALQTLNQTEALQGKLNARNGEKAEIQEGLRKAAALYDQFLSKTGR